MIVQNSVSTPPSFHTFQEYLDSRPDLSPNTKRQYKRVYNMWIKDRKELNPIGVGSFLTEHPSRHVKSGLIYICKYYKRNDLVKEIRDMKIKYKKKPEHDLPTLKEFMTVINNSDLETKHIALFLLNTGCRCQEAFSVKLGDISDDGKVIIKDVKVEGKYREIYLSDEFYRQLIIYLRYEKGVLANDNIFYTYSKATGETKRKKFYNKLNEIAYKSINKGIPTHDFRRYCATFLYEKTKDIEFVNRILGHSDISTTHKYTRYANKSTDLKKAKELLNGLTTQ